MWQLRRQASKFSVTRSKQVGSFLRLFCRIRSGPGAVFLLLSKALVISAVVVGSRRGEVLMLEVLCWDLIYLEVLHPLVHCW